MLQSGGRSTIRVVVADKQTSSLKPITLEQLVALNDEIAALVRAGVPLELGLGRLGGELPGRLGELSLHLAERMECGQSLGEVLTSQAVAFPPVYRAVVETGVRTGHLAAALESVSATARRLTQCRQTVVAGFLYPLLVFLLAWTLFVVFVVFYAPKVAPDFQSMSPAGAKPLEWLASLAGSAVFWGPAVAIVVIAIAGVWWYQSGRVSLVEPRTARLLVDWLPWMGAMLRSFRISAFADMLAMLVENGVPLPQGLRLAAESIGDPRTTRAAEAMAASLERGERLGDKNAETAGFPPLLEWLLSAGQQRSALEPALRHAAEVYYRRAMRQAEAARVFLPVLLTIAIGGGSLLIYALTLFIPWITLLRALAWPDFA